jgi:tRNA nucleotidyltransferase/poly(A) polymerase
MTRFEFFEVGGAVRDSFLGLRSKDIDYTVVDKWADVLPVTVDESFEGLENFLGEEGFKIFLSTPEYLTIRAQFPKDHPVHALHPDSKNLTADFVLARCEGPYSDGRRPDWVRPGTLEDDLARRDFTVNAVARTIHGEIIDPHGGVSDLEHMALRCVGRAEDRIKEDALRSLRAVRFVITKGFFLNVELQDILQASWLPDMLSSISAERKREELDKCFKTDTIKTLDLLWSFSPEFLHAVFSDGLRLKPTMES